MNTEKIAEFSNDLLENNKQLNDMYEPYDPATKNLLNSDFNIFFPKLKILSDIFKEEITNTGTSTSTLRSLLSDNVFHSAINSGSNERLQKDYDQDSITNELDETAAQIAIIDIIVDKDDNKNKITEILEDDPHINSTPEDKGAAIFCLLYEKIQEYETRLNETRLIPIKGGFGPRRTDRTQTQKAKEYNAERARQTKKKQQQKTEPVRQTKRAQKTEREQKTVRVQKIQEARQIPDGNNDPIELDLVSNFRIKNYIFVNYNISIFGWPLNCGISETQVISCDKKTETVPNSILFASTPPNCYSGCKAKRLSPWVKHKNDTF